MVNSYNEGRKTEQNFRTLCVLKFQQNCLLCRSVSVIIIYELTRGTQLIFIYY